jgi:hypothetical protein
MRKNSQPRFLELFRRLRTSSSLSVGRSPDVLIDNQDLYNEKDNMKDVSDEERILQLEWQVAQLQLRYDEELSRSNRLQSEMDRVYRRLNQLDDLL